MALVRTAARAIIWQGERLLVIGYQNARGPWYVLPGGGQQHGESVEAALRREVEEETGATICVGGLRFVRESMAGADSRDLAPEFHQVELFFDCELLSEPVGGATPDPTQVSFEWRTIEDLRKMCFY